MTVNGVQLVEKEAEHGEQVVGVTVLSEQDPLVVIMTGV